ncbi:MAG: DUF937 domain-containing protein [Tannerella sp.]|jgi:outer membrane protein OmpA-like peptidoglycan-associated protein|nr:DUF937 domain-containing protein [Tannerella sp.]
MESIFNSLKALITPELVSLASSKLEESESKISATIPSIFASLLGVLLKKGNSPQLKNILDEAGNLNILSDLGAICGETPTHDQQKISDDFLQHLLGDKASDFTNAIAADKGTSKVVTNRLISIVAPIISGFLGNKLKHENWSMPTLLNHIEAEKDQFISWIPSDLKKSFGIFSSPGQNNNQPQQQPKKSNGWIMWLILIILLLLLLFWWRSCRNRPVDGYIEEESITMISPAPSDNAADKAKDQATAGNETATVLELPDGTKLPEAYAGGVEDKIIKFLESDKYKNATDDDLKKIWFDLDKIKFEFGSTTKLVDGYQNQLKNIEAILHYFKDTKIEIGAFADKKGSDDINQTISEERAETFENILEENGLGSQVAKLKGFGKDYAKHLENEPDKARAEDRHIALRFVR